MKKSLIVPSSLSDITLRQWQKYASIEEPTDEQCVAILCNISNNEVLNLPNDVYTNVVGKIGLVLSQLDKPQPLKKRFKHKGVMYGIIPNMDKITYGANKDILATIGDWEKIHYSMNALYRPIVKTSGDYHDIQEYRGEETIESLRDMPLDIVLGARLFFYNLTKALLKAIPNYLQRVVQRELQDKGKMQARFTKENGEAMMKHIALLKETLEDSMR